MRKAGFHFYVPERISAGNAWRVASFHLARRALATFLSALLVFQPALLQAQQVTPDAGAPAANRPGIGSTPNGIPLVDIVTPNSAGLSHNKYSDFNVATPGLILNNSNAEVGISKLGGVTPGNANLRNSGPASVILNEVTNSRRSALEGPIELFGGRADVIIANPNGITCNGCGFINTPRATLTTGTPDVDSDGRLNGFTVQGGDITFGPRGANTAFADGAVDLFDIVSRTVTIDGPIYGKELRLTAGQSKFNYRTGEAGDLGATSGTPEYAIDGSALGAMQADRIKMVVTEKGAGVRMRADMAANVGELSLSSDGKISIGNASGNQGVSLTSKRNVSAGRLTSKKAVSVKAGKDVALASVGAVGDILINGGSGLVDVSGSLAGNGALSVAADGNLSLSAATAAGPVSLASLAGTVTVAGTVQSDASLSLTAAAGSIAAGSLLSQGDVALLSGLELGISGGVLAGGNLRAVARGDIRYGILEANGTVSLTSISGAIDLERRTAAGGDIAINERQVDLSGNRSGLATSGTLRINTESANLSGSQMTFGGIDLVSSGNVDLRGTGLNAVSSSNALNAANGAGDIAIAAGSLSTTAATNLLAAHDLTLSLPQLTNAGQVAAGNDLIINVGNLTNAASGLVYAGNDAALFVGGVLANDQGAIVAGRDLVIAGSADGARNAATVNRSGLINSNRNMTITTANLRNEKTVAPTVITQLVSNTPITAYDGLEGEICTPCSPNDNAVEYNGKFYVVQGVENRVYRNFLVDQVASYGSQAALIKAGNILAIDTVDLTNSYSTIEAGKQITLSGTGTLTNSGIQLQRTTSLSCTNPAGCRYYPDFVYARWVEYSRGGDSTNVREFVRTLVDNPFGTRDASKDLYAGTTVESVEAIGGVPATILSGGALSINGFAAVNNSALAGTIADRVAVGASTPSNNPTTLLAGVTAGGALFTLGSVASPQSGGFGGTVPGQTFLFETRAAFLDVSKFYGSSYFLGRIGYQPDREIQFLGDAYFENRYVEQQLRQATGAGFTGEDPTAQIKRLLDNGADYLGTRQLALGESLTADEIAGLTQSIVVYEWQVVNGERVLAPVLYLASGDKEQLASSGAVIAGKDVTIDVGTLATSGMIAASGDVAISGSSIAATGGDIRSGGTTNLDAGRVSLVSSSVTSGGNMSIKGTDGILIAGSKVAAGGNLALTSNGDINVSVTEKTTTSTMRDRLSSTTRVETTVTGSQISAGGSIAAAAGGNLNVIGSALAADGTLGLKAAGDVTIAEAVETTTTDYSYKKKGGLFGGGKQTTSHAETQTSVGSSVSGGAGVTIASGGDTIVSASKLTAGDGDKKADIDVTTGGDLLIASGRDSAAFEQSSSSKGFLSKKSSQLRSYDETTVASELSASGNVKLNAAGSAAIAGSTVTAGEAITVEGDNVSIIGATEQRQVESSSTKSGLFAGSGGGFISLWGKSQKDTIQSSEFNVASALSAGTSATIKARDTDLNVIGSSITAGQDINLSANRDVNITPGMESASASEQDKRSGFGIAFSAGNGGFSVGIGVQNTTDKKAQGSDTNATSILTAGRDVNISAGNNINLQAAQASAERDVNLFAGGDINLLAVDDATNYQEAHEKTFAGVTMAVSSQVGSAAQSIINSAGRLTESGGVNPVTNTTIVGLGIYQGLRNLESVYDEYRKSGDIGFALTVSLGVNRQQSSSSSTAYAPVVTDIRAGRSISMEADRGSITSDGAKIAAGYDELGIPVLSADPLVGDIILSAANGAINLNAATGTSATDSRNSSYSAGVGIGFDCSVKTRCKTIGTFVDGSYGKGGAGSSAVTQYNSLVSGTGDVAIGADGIAIRGGTVSGNSVTVAANSLTIESPVDTVKAKAEQLNVSASVGAAASVSSVTQNAKGDAAVVSEQSGIRAGVGGLDINIDGKTSLVGGVISSDASADRNHLSTGTLEATDIDTNSSWKADTYGGSFGTGGLSIAPPVKAGENETGKAYAAIGGNIGITITDPAQQAQDIGTIRRDTANTNTSLPGLPDLESLLRNQYKTQADLQAAQVTMAGLVADIANKLWLNAPEEEKAFWAEGGPGRAALHALGGGLLGGVNGVGGAVKGALGGAASTLFAKAVKELVAGMMNDAKLGSEEDRAKLGAVFGATIMAAIGGAIGGGEGAAYGAASYQYNYLADEDLFKAADALAEAEKCQSDCAALWAKVNDFKQLSERNDAVLIATCTAAPASSACQQMKQDLLKFATRLDRAGIDVFLDIGPGGNPIDLTFDADTLEQFSATRGAISLDVILARQLAEADKNGLPTDVAIKQALTQISQIQGGIKALLDSAGIVGGAAACAGTAGAACVLGLIGAAVSANQLVASAQQSFTGEEARTALVYSLEKAGYSKEEAERYQRYMDIGAVVLSVGIVGGEVAVRFTAANLGAIASVAERQAVLQALDKIPPLRTVNGKSLNPKLPDPAAGYDYVPKTISSPNPNIANSHVNGFNAEIDLANQIADLPGQQVIRYGDAIGTHGADVISVDVNTGEVFLWDSKFRNAFRPNKSSPTFKPGSTALSKALAQAERTISSSNLSSQVRQTAMKNLTDGQFVANTVGTASVKNLVPLKFCDFNPC
ncbi:hemagglutinin repeat-containing protein [Rhizobium metallidurans]|uniref:Filamentous hemagglutinin n=1 Tax=Rhizobium metallidurans TaxID=1265931 RepID=A0A7W6CXN9_9HYPH|nr:hemagglutinin repeat-containing protein [Rhizobium metallidurans]MBB3966757.1 filamentous hemagglutinin [Rhizobium metallidurans]